MHYHASHPRERKQQEHDPVSLSKDSKDKVAFITGGGSGIGKAIAKSFVEEGAIVCLAARNQENMDSSGQGVRGRWAAEALAIPMDISQGAGRHRRRQDGHRRLRPHRHPGEQLRHRRAHAYVWDLKLDEWNEIIAVDLTGSMLAAREVLKYMVPAGKGGSIINIGAEGGRSGDGRSGYPMRAGYCCAKMGVIGLTETLARECGPHGIRVNCISPGRRAGPALRAGHAGPGRRRGYLARRGSDQRDEAVLARPADRGVRTGPDRGLPGQRRVERHHRPDHPAALRHEHVEQLANRPASRGFAAASRARLPCPPPRPS